MTPRHHQPRPPEEDEIQAAAEGKSEIGHRRPCPAQGPHLRRFREAFLRAPGMGGRRDGHGPRPRREGGLRPYPPLPEEQPHACLPPPQEDFLGGREGLPKREGTRAQRVPIHAPGQGQPDPWARQVDKEAWPWKWLLESGDGILKFRPDVFPFARKAFLAPQF